MSRPTVIGLGELLWDVFPDGRRAGGAPANVAYQANQLGANGIPASRVGTDDDGEMLLQFLGEHGVDTALIQRDSEHSTGRVTVKLSEGGQPSYVIHQEVAWEYLQPESALLNAVRTSGAICFGTLAQRTPVSRETIHRCLEAAGEETLVVYDVNLRQRWYEREWIESSLRLADVVKLNDEEQQILAPLLEVAGSNPADFAAHLQQLGVQTVVITRGEKGCAVFGENESADVAGEPVEVVDTVGAGDAFTAAFIVGSLRGWPLETVARLANRVGGLVASRPGAMPDVAAEADELMACAESGRL